MNNFYRVMPFIGYTYYGPPEYEYCSFRIPLHEAPMVIHFLAKQNMRVQGWIPKTNILSNTLSNAYICLIIEKNISIYPELDYII